MNDQEIEVKFYLRDLPALERRLQAAGARLVQPRVLEINLRFDTPARELTAQKRVLRLRRDQSAWLTYKNPAKPGEPVSVRQEIEIEVNDFEAARRLLEALGYQVSIIYEKFRAAYELGGTHVTLDEMPYGSFAEIEGDSAEAIQSTAATLGLDWSARISESYLALFDRLRARRGLDLPHLTFELLRGAQVSAEDLGIRPADL